MQCKYKINGNDFTKYLRECFNYVHLFINRVNGQDHLKLEI